MNKNVKKTLLFVAILIVVIVIISVIYLLLPAPGEDGGKTPEPSGSVSAPVSPSPTKSAPAQTQTPPESERYTREETADGTIFHITVPGGLTAYSVTVDEKVFDLTETDGRMMFRSNADKNQFLEFSFIEDSKAADLAPSFLDSYQDYREFEQSGREYIGNTEISGEAVTVNDGKTQLETRLVDTENGVLAVVIGYSLPEKETQRAELEKMLNTLIVEGH